RPRDHREDARLSARGHRRPAQPPRVRPREHRHRRGLRADPRPRRGPRGVRRRRGALHRRADRMSPSPAVAGTTAAQSTREDRLPREAGLTAFEAARVRAPVGREPNALEWGMFGAMWSEHCAYKHSRSLLRTLPTRGARVAIGPGENAGAVDLGDGL